MPVREQLEKRGVKASALADKPLNFIGAAAGITFNEMAARMAQQFTVDSRDIAGIGDAYETGFYQRTAGSKERTYERVYGAFDWTKASEDATTLQILEEAYGNNDNASKKPDIDPNNLRRIYGSTKAAPNRLSGRERAAGAADAQNNTRQQRDSTSRGIRGVADIDAPIEPLA